jgi:hypothetical protein
MFFKKRPTVDADEQDWVLSAWRWLDDVLGPVQQSDTLWLPSHKHFPQSGLSEDAAAQHDFDLIKGKCGMATWPTRLVRQRARPLLAATLAHDAVVANDPGGTFRIDGETAVITYDPALLQARQQLLFTFAHELAHYALTVADSSPPGGEAFSELITDLAAAHLGFGWFGATCVVKSYSGPLAYMPEHLWYFATALFCELAATPASDYDGYGPSWVKSAIRQNRAFLQANPTALRALQVPAADSA